MGEMEKERDIERDRKKGKRGRWAAVISTQILVLVTTYHIIRRKCQAVN